LNRRRKLCKKCWVAASVIFVIGIALAFALPALLPPAPGITYANFSRIEKGMTREQVEALFGASSRAPRFSGRYWESEAGDSIWITYDERGQVEEAHWNGWPDKRTSLEKLRDRLPLIARDPPGPAFISR
jgi:hypothetical protein